MVRIAGLLQLKPAQLATFEGKGMAMANEVLRFIQLKKDYGHAKENVPERYDVLDRLMIEAIVAYGEAEGLPEEQRYAFMPQLDALVGGRSGKPIKAKRTQGQNEERR